MIRSIEIHGLRGIREGRLDDLTPLVVLVGSNGCGKSTVLEALLLAAGPSPADSVRIVASRRKVRAGVRWMYRTGGSLAAPVFEVEVGRDRGRAVRRRFYSGTIGANEWTVLFEQLRDEAIQRDAFSIAHGSTPVTGSSEQKLLGVFSPEKGFTASESIDTTTDLGDVRFVDASDLCGAVSMHTLYTRAAEQGRKREAVAILRKLMPDLVGIEILTEDDVPVVYLDYGSQAVPAALAGDGIHVLLRTTLELAARPDGLVLLEEPEIHQHPAAILQTAHVIVAAVSRGIQVVLATHSLELIDALVHASGADADLEKLAVFHLRLEEGELKASRTAGPDVAFVRSTVDDDLR